MTVSSVDYTNIYNGDGSTVTFPNTLTVTSADNLLVYIVDSTGTITYLSLGTDYSLSETFDEITFVTAPAATDDIYLVRTDDLTQGLDLENTTAIDADSLEAALDKLTYSMQGLRYDLNRAVKVDIVTGGVTGGIADIAGGGANKYLRFNDTGDGIEAVTLSTDTLAIVSNLTGSTGLVTQTGSSTYAARTLTAGNGIAITNGTGVSGNPTVALSSSPITLSTTLSATGLTAAAGSLTLTSAGGANISLQAAAAATGTVTYKLPDADGTNGQVLKTNGAGQLSWVANSSTPPSAGGSTTQIQYNSSGAFAGDTGFTTNGSGTLTVTGRLDVDNLRIDGNAISATNTNGNITLQPAGSGTVSITGTQTVAGRLDVDNIRIDGSEISNTASNANIILTPNGTGKVVLDTLLITADPGSPAVGQVLACTSLSSGTQITLADNAATSTTYGQVQLYDVSVDGSNSTSTAATQVLTPGGARSLSCVAQGWLRFNGTGTPAQIDTNYNFSSITDNGTGDYSIDFSTSLATGNEFCVSVTGSATIGYYLSSGSDTNTVHIQMKNDAGTLTDDAHISVIVFGLV